MKKQALDNGQQERWHGTLADICALQVQSPEIQRDVDPDRVQAICDFQEARLRERGSYLFLGDLALLMNDRGRLWIVDGQHRLRAAQRLCAACADHPCSVLVLSSDAVGLQEAFRLVNTAVPVPEWLVDGTVQARQRCMLRAVESDLRRRFGSFLSTATTPRRPNVSLSALMSALATAACRRPGEFPAEPEHVVAYLLWCNRRLRGNGPVSTAAVDKAARAGVEPLFFANDLTFEFVQGWLDQWLATPPEAPEAPTRPRRAIPKATRIALWNRTFGERRGIGACHCCRREVTQQDFECGHVVAAARGGTDALDNLRPLCATCNRSMGAEDMDAFMKRTGLGRVGPGPASFPVEAVSS